MSDATIVWGTSHWAVPIALVAIAFVGLVLWSYGRSESRRPLKWLAASCKILAVLLLTLCLLEPLLSGVRPRPGANVFAILVDNSRSMEVKGRGLPAGPALKSWLGPSDAGWRARLAQDFDVRIYAVDRDLHRLEGTDELDFGGDYSNLSAALTTLSERFADRPLAGVLLVSDGNATDAPRDLSGGALPRCPVYPVIPSRVQVPSDVRLERVQVSQSFFETSPTTVTADVVSHAFARQPLVVQLRKAGGDLVEEQALVAQGDGRGLPVRFRFRPEEPGLSFYQLAVFPAVDRDRFTKGESSTEATLANNTRTILVDRGGGPFRVLYLAGRPNWEFKFLRRALEEDEEIQLVGLLRIANKEPKFQFRDRAGASDTNRLFEGFDAQSEDEAENYDEPVLLRIGVENAEELAEGFPKDDETLFRYDAVVIDDIDASFFSPDQMLLLRRYVSQRGGALLMLGGIDTLVQGGYARTPLGEMLPVYLTRQPPLPTDATVRLKLTREGLLETWTRLRSTEAEEDTRLSSMPSFRTLNKVGGIKPGAVAVAEAVDDDAAEPAIVTQRFGKGRTAAILLGDLWHWALNRPRMETDDLATFWRQTMRWLVAESPQRAELRVNSEAGSAAVRLEVAVRDADFEADDDASVEMVVTRPSGESTKLSLEPSSELAGVYAAEYWPQENGGYRVTARVIAGQGEPLIARDQGWVTAPEQSEFDRLELNVNGLSQLAAETGGQLIDPDQISQFVANRRRQPVPVTEHWVAPLWHQAWVFAAAIFCLCAEWGLRRWKGLT